MKTPLLRFALALTLCFAANGFAVVRYVNVNNATPASPYTSWATAATNIQHAIDAASSGDQIVVSNGVYRTGGTTVATALTNRVAINKSVTVSSLNGPAVTLIEGFQLPGSVNGPGAVRCAYVGSGAVLSGFTLTNGATMTDGPVNTQQCGGGAYVEPSGIVTNCVLTRNAAHAGGGAVLLGTLNNCYVLNNSSPSGSGGGANSTVLNNCVVFGNVGLNGGGLYGCTANNCTVVSNTAVAAGGATWGGGLNNTIAYHNTAGTTGMNHEAASFNYSCTVPLPAGPGNITNAPVFANLPAGDLRALSNSPTINTGNNSYAVVSPDPDGNPRIFESVADMGAYELQSFGALIVSISPDATLLLTGMSTNFQGTVLGGYTNLVWNFGDGTGAMNTLSVSHSWSSAGQYPVTLQAFSPSYPAGIIATAMVTVVSQMVHYVNRANSTPSAPYLTWETAATNIQDAIDVAFASSNSMVLVTNGTYETGNRIVHGQMRNRIVIDKPIQVKSVNGPAFTSIRGFQVPGTTNGDGAIRCAYVANGALLSGFTLTNGATRVGGDLNTEQCGGAVLGQSTASVISNCVVVGNAAAGGAAGVILATLNNCILTRNISPGGSGGAVNSCTLNNCLVYDNVGLHGGGAFGSTLRNCTVTGNSVVAFGGGLWGCTVWNSIVYYNTAPSEPNHSSSLLTHSCTTPLPAGAGNTAMPPLFVNVTNDFHLQTNSPCINTGTSAAAVGPVDLDGSARIVGSAVDMGVYEYPVALPMTVAVSANSTNVMRGVSVNLSASVIGGVATNLIWDFGDGTGATNVLDVSHSWSFAGEFSVVFRAFNPEFPGGVSSSVTIYVVSDGVAYVNAANANPVFPYGSWATAATNIQDAIDASPGGPGSVVLVTNGTYRFGGRIATGNLSNRVAVIRPIQLRSVNGPEVTFIEGYQMPGATNGDMAMRCVYLTNGASLDGFTLTGGATRTNGPLNSEQCGGGVFCDPTAVVTNCVFIGNAAHAGGGGGILGTFNNCTFIGNRSPLGNGGAINAATLNNCVLRDNIGLNGGAAINSVLNNCTVVSNAVSGAGGGVWGCNVRNSIVYHNTAANGTNHASSSLSYSCTTGVSPTGGNITNPPVFLDLAGGDLRLHSSSFCINMGTNALVALDVDRAGDPRIIGGTVDMGAYEFQEALPLLVFVSPGSTNAPPGLSVTFNAQVFRGFADGYSWDFGDGSTAQNVTTVAHSWSASGNYNVVFQAFNGSGTLSATATVQVAGQQIHYVNADSAAPQAPFLSWATAATNIQDAIDAALPATSSVVLVTNGIYQTGGRVVHATLSNRVVINKPILVRSVNGPDVTIIRGHQLPFGSVGSNAVRCVYLTNGATLSGFTLTNGATSVSGNANQEQSGGGVLAHSTGAVVSNCVISGNVAFAGGGGALLGTFKACTFIGNSAAGGTGGGANSSVLINCVLNANVASFGGGAYNCSATNSSIAGNAASISGGGTWGGSLNNSIVYHNASPTSPNYSGGTFRFCSVTPLPAGAGNFTNAPRFVDLDGDDLHLLFDSPCINSGNAAYLGGGTDRDGNARVIGGFIDVGAYETQSPISAVPFVWLWQNGLAINSGTDAADADGDGFNNYQEWRSGTSPTNALSLLKLLEPETDPSGIAVTWLSVAGTNYFLERGGDVTQPFTAIRSNIAGQAGTTTYIDTNAVSEGPYLYRVGVQ